MRGRSQMGLWALVVLVVWIIQSTSAATTADPTTPAPATPAATTPDPTTPDPTTTLEPTTTEELTTTPEPTTTEEPTTTPEPTTTEEPTTTTEEPTTTTTQPTTTTTPLPATLVLNSIDVEVNEEETSKIDLYTAGPIATCSGPEPTRSYLESVSPTNPCGIKCFEFVPCTTTNDEEYCLYFLGSEGTLSYIQTPIYTLSIVCTNDKDDPVREDLTVTVVPNSPPQFVPNTLTDAVSITSSAAILESDPQALLYTVGTNDVDDDPIFYTLTTSPSGDYLEIGRNTGEIRAKESLLTLCEDTIEAKVTATDNYNTAIGPKTITFTIDNANDRPSVTNLNTIIEVDENTAADTTILSLDVVDTFNKFPTRVRMISSSSAGLELYKLDGYDLKLKAIPNFERSDTRSVQLYFDADDGYCISETYTLTVNIKNVNEEPVLQQPTNIYVEVWEGNIYTPSGLVLDDEDFGDTHKYTLVSGGDNILDLDLASGDVYSKSELDIDNNREYKDYTLEMLVTDSGGLTDTADIIVRVRDINDQKPYFMDPSYTFAVTECNNKPGTALGDLTGADDDSEYNNNNKFYFGGGGGKTAVTSLGNIVLTSPMISGESFTAQATITDQGIYPKPLSGDPVTYTVSCCTPCPTVAPVPGGGGGGGGGSTTAAPGGGTTGTATVDPGASTGNVSDGLLDNAGWIIPAILIGLLWLALTTFCIYRYCFPCRCPQRAPRPVKVKAKKPDPPKPKQRIKRQPEPEDIKPAPKLNIPAEAPPPPPPKSFLFGFWKEKYTDQHHVNNPNRSNKPIAIEAMPNEGNPEEAPENLKLGGATGPRFLPNTSLNQNNPSSTSGPGGAQAPPPKKPWRCCNIL